MKGEKEMKLTWLRENADQISAEPGREAGTVSTQMGSDMYKKDV
jgi:hypothetical protein